jgi:lipopolysaccharide transport system ATP-binding protein
MGKITVDHLGKAYKQYPTRWSRLREWLAPNQKAFHTLKHVLQDINFTIHPGEAVGIIGINGAGKSTLLKLITGTTQPSTGSVHMTGRVAAMLELGMGFHPDFTGRQNAIMAGQLLGISSTEILRLMPEIEAFAEIGGYIDQPVRVYSSGMQMRLAFSVATAIRPDILIVDEALSVGDAYFQHKSFDRIRAFRKQGTTLLIVSHDKQAIISICDRAILLSHGKVAMEGPPEAVMDFYNAMLADHQDQKIQQVVNDKGNVQTISGTGEVSLTEIGLIDELGQPLDVVAVGQQVTLFIKVKSHTHIDELVIGFVIKDRLGQAIFGTNTHHYNQPLQAIGPNQLIEFQFEFKANLGLGAYSIAVAAHSQDTHLENSYEWRDQAFIFNIINTNKPVFVGMAWLQPTIKVMK